MVSKESTPLLKYDVTTSNVLTISYSGYMLYLPLPAIRDEMCRGHVPDEAQELASSLYSKLKQTLNSMIHTDEDPSGGSAPQQNRVLDEPDVDNHGDEI